MISCAPCNASSAEETSFSLAIYFSASDCTSPSVSCISHSASGSSPFSLAIVAFVRRFCLYGRYKSSTCCIFTDCVISVSNSGVSFPCSSISRITSFFRFSKFSRYAYRSSISRIWTSSRLPVISFR